jgi:hypothetical protein
MRASVWFLGGAVAGALLTFRLVPAQESACCARVAGAVRSRAGWAAGLLDAFGITAHAPALLDKLGVPYDA